MPTISGVGRLLKDVVVNTLATTNKTIPGAINELNTKLPRVVHCYGQILNSGNGSISGSGGAQIEISGNIAKIDFIVTITQAGTNANNFFYGINRDIIKDKTGIAITPVGGGTAAYFTNNILNKDITGYCGLFQANTPFWTPARIYQDDGASGSWPETMIPAGTVIIGSCYGTI